MTRMKFFCLFALALCMTSLHAQNPFGQTLQINTRFRSITGKPTWLLIVRDVNTGVVSPYLFDIKNNDNYWIAFTYGHSYRITVSKMKFGPLAVINNFCRLENGIISGQSMMVSVWGRLTPYRGNSECRVLKYKSSNFPITTSG